jgi:glycine/D-amino acid oxidase-like deaminating enzyme
LGLSAARSLSRRGWSVEVLEEGDAIGHPLAGSKGDARIFRLGYPEPHYVKLAIAARALWHELEEDVGCPLLRVTGQLSFGEAAEVDAVAASLARLGEPAERLTSSDVRSRFPAVSLSGPALFEPGSGVLAADECLRALCASASFEVRTGTRVTELTQTDNGATVHTFDEQARHADVVIDCAGPTALALLGPPATTVVGAPPSLPQVAYFSTADPGSVDPARLPVFIEWGDAMVYGLPVLGSGAHAGTFKVSHHTPGPPLDTYDPTTAISPLLDEDDPSLLAVLTDAVRRLLPGLDPEPVATERCIYDNSVDTDFVLDRVGNVVVGCGTSGHGFKFGPLLGELLADLADGTAARLDLRPFRLKRMVAANVAEAPGGRRRVRGKD